MSLVQGLSERPSRYEILLCQLDYLSRLHTDLLVLDRLRLVLALGSSLRPNRARALYHAG